MSGKTIHCPNCGVLAGSARGTPALPAEGLVADCENRAASLMREAVSLGCDTPTEAMISAAIYDAVCDHEQHLEFSLMQDGHEGAAQYLARCRALRHLEGGVEQ